MIGSIVRIYYESDGFDCVFDEGSITIIDNGFITVDFFDWIERWPEDQFSVDPMFQTLTPIGPGTIVMDFRIRPDVVVPLWEDRQSRHTV